MAALTPSLVPVAPSTLGTLLTVNTLSASDTYAYDAGDIILMRNTTGGSLTVATQGEGGNIFPDGLGAIGVSASQIWAAQASGAARSMFTDTRSLFYQGTVTITGASGMTCLIIRGVK